MQPQKAGFQGQPKVNQGPAAGKEQRCGHSSSAFSLPGPSPPRTLLSCCLHPSLFIPSSPALLAGGPLDTTLQAGATHGGWFCAESFPSLPPGTIPPERQISKTQLKSPCLRPRLSLPPGLATLLGQEVRVSCREEGISYC